MINKIVCDDLGREFHFKVEELKEETYYVVEIKLHSCHVAHKAIMITGYNEEGKVRDCFLLSLGYECPKRELIDNIFWFKILCEIPEMKGLPEYL